jgi:putative phosphoribosyl transferase
VESTGTLGAMRYVDRADAGRILAGYVATALADAGETNPPLVLGIPRGGVIVAAPVAAKLGGELNVALAKKIRAPGNPELALGAVGENGTVVAVDEVVKGLGVSPEVFGELARRAGRELEESLAVYRRVKPAPAIGGRVVVLVDDGVATGATFRATLETIRRQDPGLLVGAIPVGPIDTTDELERGADILVCPERPRWFQAVGQWYDEFTQVSDEEVTAVLG